MRNYNYTNKWVKLLSPDIVALLSQIHEFKGRQNLFIELKEGTLTHLVELAKIQSTSASNAIEGIHTSDERLVLIVKNKTTANTRDEHEIAGYRDVLASIHENHDYIPPTPSMILQLHRDLYKFTGLSFAGNYKSNNNTIAEMDADGNKSIRFQPVEAWETSISMEELCKNYSDIIGQGKVDPLLIIPMFVLDFLCIHPFNDGNGRMSRLLTLLLLYRAGYIVGKYISIEKLIEQTKETYYEALKDSSANWHEGTSNDEPFVKYMLGLIVAAYRDFENKADILITKGLSKPERVAEMIKESLGKISKKELSAKCSDISDVTVQRALNSLIQNNKITKLGGGRYTTYVWNRKKES